MHMIFVIVFVVHVCVVSSSSLMRSVWNDPCTISPDGFLREPNTIRDITALSTCENGTVYWNYPKGNVTIHFQNTESIAIRVCFHDGMGGYMFDITDVTGGGKRRLHPFPSGGETCTQKYNSDIVVMVTAPRLLMYVGAFKYRITY